MSKPQFFLHLSHVILTWTTSRRSLTYAFSVSMSSSTTRLMYGCLCPQIGVRTSSGSHPSSLKTSGDPVLNHQQLLLLPLLYWYYYKSTQESANLRQSPNFNQEWSGIQIQIFGLIRIRMSVGSVPKCCGCIILSVISPSMVQIGSWLYETC